MIQFAIFTAPGGTLIGDYSNRIQKLTFATNTKGDAECSGFIPMSLAESFQLYDRVGLPHVQIADGGASIIYEGRLEDVEIVSGGVNIRAFGYSRALSDIPRVLFWSTTDIASWKSMPADVGGFANRTPDKYSFDFNNHVQIALEKNAVYANNTDVGQAYYALPYGSSRVAVTFSFDWVGTLPANWSAEVEYFTEAWVSVGATAVWTGTGGTSPGSFISLAVPANTYRVSIRIYNATGGNYTNTQENGVWFFRANNIRITSAATNAINTTITGGGVLAGTNVSIPVGSTARMYVGQKVFVGATGAPLLGESTAVKSITDATHFVADLTAGHAAGQAVQAALIYTDEVVQGLTLGVNASNATQLASSLTFIQSPGKDLFDLIIADQYPSDVLDRLITLGDSQSTPRQWEWGVATNRYLYFRPQFSAARTWYVDLSAIDIQRTIDSLYNSVYATYQEASGRTLRTAASADSASIARYGLTRQKAQQTQTTSSIQAGTERDAALTDTKTPKPRSGLETKWIFDARGAMWPVYLARGGDTVVIRNLPPTLSAEIDLIRTFRIARTEYRFASNTVAIEPETPLPSLDALLALATAPTWVTAPWWVQVGEQ